MPLLLIIDESLDKRLATELKARGHAAETHASIGFTSIKDPGVLDMLAEIETPWVLVTGDDFMPAEHAEKLAEIGATVAVVDGEWEKACAMHEVERTQEEFKRDTVHRWAHSIEEQEAGTIRRYTPWRNDKWTLRKKHAQRLAATKEEDERAGAATREGSGDPGPQTLGLG